MNKKQKKAFNLILIGIGIPLFLFFFQTNGNINFGNLTYKQIERRLNEGEIKALEDLKKTFEEAVDQIQEEEGASRISRWFILKEAHFLYMGSYKKAKFKIKSKLNLNVPYKYFIGIGILLILIGIGRLPLFSKEK